MHRLTFPHLPSLIPSLILGGAAALLAACGAAETASIEADLANAAQILVAAQPVASEAACAAQAGANISTDLLTMTGNADGAMTASAVSKAAGAFCDGLAAGTPLPVPVAVPVPVLRRIAPEAASPPQPQAS